MLFLMIYFVLAMLIMGVYLLHKENNYSWVKSIMIVLLVISGVAILLFFCAVMIFKSFFCGYHG